MLQGERAAQSELWQASSSAQEVGGKRLQRLLWCCGACCCVFVCSSSPYIVHVNSAAVHGELRPAGGERGGEPAADVAHAPPRASMHGRKRETPAQTAERKLAAAPKVRWPRLTLFTSPC